MGSAIFISGPAGAGKSSVAVELSKLLHCPVVEVDDVKLKRRCTTERSSTEDLVDAGDQAAAALAKSDQVIVVEAFGPEAPFVELVAQQLPRSTSIRHFYLWCQPDIAVERKKGALSPSIVRQQFGRFPGPAHPDRTSINTTRRRVQEVAAEIATALEGTGAS